MIKLIWINSHKLSKNFDENIIIDKYKTILKLSSNYEQKTTFVN